MTGEHPLEEQSDDMLRLLDSFPALIWLKDCHNNFIRLNKLAAQTLGFSADDFKFTPASELYPNEAEGFYADDLIVISSGQPRLGIIEQISTVTGEKRWIRTDKVPYRDKNGNIIGIIVFAVDINENKLAHEQLQRSHEYVEASLKETSTRLESITNTMPGVVFQFLLKADGSMSFPYLSDSLTPMFGFLPAEITEDVQVAFSRIPPDDLQRMYQQIKESAESMRLFQFEGRFRTKSNVERWVNVSSIPSRLSNGDVLFNGLFMDITDLKEAHAQIRHLNEELEHRVLILASVNKELELLTHKLESAYEQAMGASKLKSEFVANISHEVRTPISAVIGMTGLLLDTALSGEQKQFVRIIRESAESLLTIINDILDFSKIEADKMELECIAFDLRHIVEGCADLLSSAASQKGVRIRASIHPSAPKMAVGDPMRLRQILLNLCSNAVKFTEHGEISLRVKKIGARNGADLLKFEVSDTGIGLTSEAQRMLFQPFVQADGSTTRRYGGTGLGLSICKRLVELMGGQIGVTSKVDEGSNFWFTATFEKASEQNFKRFDTHAAHVPTVLLLDRLAQSRLIIENYLAAAGVKVELSVSFPEALRKMSERVKKREKIDVLIVNADNASTDPEEIGQAVLQDAELRSTKLILLGTSARVDSRQKALECGFDEFISRPVERYELIEVISKLCKSYSASYLRNEDRSEEDEKAVAHADGAWSTTPGQTRPPDKSMFAGKHVLLAEDNPVMRELGLRQLQKIGVSVDAVSNGLEALKALSSKNYSLILMDCQMPEMDGFEATRSIRKKEKAEPVETNSTARLPIIAMTASAMTGDRDQCLAAGMDDYLIKPVDPQMLRTVLERWILKYTATSSPGAPDSSDSNNSGPINVEKLKKLYGADALDELLHSFVLEGKNILSLMKQCQDRQDDRELAVQAHQLKGLSAVMTAESTQQLSLELERAAKAAAWEQSGESLGKIEQEFEAVTNFINRILEQQQV